MGKNNCWSFKRCGREPAADVREMGICPASVERKLHDIHEGHCAGRACWIVAGTFCGQQEQGTFAQKYHNCVMCGFYQMVKEEERLRFKMSPMLLAKLRNGG